MCGVCVCLFLALKLVAIDERPVGYESGAPDVHARRIGGHTNAKYAHSADRLGRQHDTDLAL